MFVDEAAPGLHWVSVFFAFLDGKSIAYDIQLDGEKWEGAQEAWNEWRYDAPPGYVSGRHFFIAVPQGERADG